MLTDGELLRRYVEDKAQVAFTELVNRHINVVYRAALRRVGGDAHSADDVTQKVFTDLARKAPTLTNHPSLAGWLYTGTRFAAAEAVRAAQRRRGYEEKAHTMHEPEVTPTDNGDLEAVLDEVMDRLPPQDRDAIVLHFFEGRTFVEIGESLSMNADAVRMRVNRALNRLRSDFAARGVASTGAALTAVLASQSTFAAPTTLAAAVASHAMHDAGIAQVAGTSVGGLVELMKSSTTWMWTGGVAVLVVAGFVITSSSTPGPSHAAAEAPQGRAAASITSAATESPVAIASNNDPAISVTAAGDAVPANGNVARVTTVIAGPRGASAFALLSDEEKNLLKMLWRQRQAESQPSGVVRGYRFGAQAPNVDGIDPLVSRGLAREPRPNFIVLSDEGVAFCGKHASEIEAHQLPTNPLPAATTVSEPVRPFAAMTDAEKNLLKRLWQLQQIAAPPPGKVSGLRVGANAPGIVGIDPLVAQGLVRETQQNFIILTKEGAAFCERHASEIEAHPLPTNPSAAK